jgi:hypothetical protein
MFQIQNDKELPVVKTAYDIDEVNEYVKNGHRSILREIKRNPRLQSNFCIFRNRINGLLVEAPAREFGVQYGEWIEYPEVDWELILESTYYAREREPNQSWAAYILPLGLQANTAVYLEDIIEDVYVGEFWYSLHYASDAIALWTGDDLEIDYQLLKDRYVPLVG